MKRLYKLPKSWVYLTHPLGYDPYDSYATSYMVNSATYDLTKIKDNIANSWCRNQDARNEVATAGGYKSAPMVAPFDGNPFL